MCNVCFLVVVKAFLAMLQTWWNTSLSFLKHYICFFLISCRHMLHTLPDRWHITFAFSWHVAYASWHNIYIFPDMLHTLPDITFTFSWHVTYASWHYIYFFLTCYIRFLTWNTLLLVHHQISHNPCSPMWCYSPPSSSLWGPTWALAPRSRSTLPPRYLSLPHNPLLVLPTTLHCTCLLSAFAGKNQKFLKFCFEWPNLVMLRSCLLLWWVCWNSNLVWISEKPKQTILDGTWNLNQQINNSQYKSIECDRKTGSTQIPRCLRWRSQHRQLYRKYWRIGLSLLVTGQRMLSWQSDARHSIK